MATEEHHIPDEGEPHTTEGYCRCHPSVRRAGHRLTVWTHFVLRALAAAAPPGTVPPLHDRIAVSLDDLPDTEP